MYSSPKVNNPEIEANFDKLVNTIVLFSGGVDSTVVATLVAQKSFHVKLLNVQMKPSKIRTNRMRAIAEYLGVELEIVDAEPIFSKLVFPGVRYTPGYRFIQYAIACSFADRYDANYIYTGETDISFGAYGDVFDNDWRNNLNAESLGRNIGWEDAISVRNDFSKLYNRMYLGNCTDEPELAFFVDPLLGMHRPAIVQLGSKLHAPLAMTITCQSDIDALPAPFDHCGQCPYCVQRWLGFYLAGVPDPTVYHNIDIGKLTQLATKLKPDLYRRGHAERKS